MPSLVNLRIDRVDRVDAGANADAHIVLFKRRLNKHRFDGSYDGIAQKVRGAYESAFPHVQGQPYRWVEAVFPSYVVVQEGEDYHVRPYVENDDGDYTFGDKVEVKVTTDIAPILKAAAAKAGKIQAGRNADRLKRALAALREMLDEIEAPTEKAKTKVCKECGESFPVQRIPYDTCPDCGGRKTKAATKTEDGEAFGASDYAYVPDADKPSTWKLRLTASPGGTPDARIVGAAVAALGKGFRGNKVELPADAVAAVKRRVRAAWRKANPDADAEDMPAVLKRGVVAPPMNRPHTVRGRSHKEAQMPNEIAKKAADLLEVLKNLPDDAEQAAEAIEQAVADAEELSTAAAALPEPDAKPETINKDELPEPVRKALEDAERVTKDAQDKADKATADVAKMQHDARRRDFVDIAKSLPHIAQGELADTETAKDVLAEALHDVADKAPETWKRLEPALKAVNAQLEKSALFSEVGRPGNGGASAIAKVKAAAEEIRKSKPELSPEQAEQQALSANPGLYEEYLQEIGS